MVTGPAAAALGPGAAPPLAPPVVELVDAVSRVDGRTLIDQVSLTVRPGTLWAVTGLDGCGKSALLNLISTLVPPEAGTVRLFGQDTVAIGEKGRRALRLEIGVVFEQGALLDGFTDYIFVTIDMSDPANPREKGYFIPQPAAGRDVPWTNDVAKDDRGLIYVTDKVCGLDVLEFNM